MGLESRNPWSQRPPQQHFPRDYELWPTIFKLNPEIVKVNQYAE